MRKDFAVITEIVPEYSKVLDIGCGDGTLLSHLANYKKTVGRGIEINSNKVSQAIAKGVSVIQGDIDNDLKKYPDDAVDIAILSQTLQVTKNPKEILTEMMRIAKFSIISVPNFGYIENRLHLLLCGKMPVTRSLSYQWYDTPNIHFCTVKDFEILAKDIGFKICDKHFINDSKLLPNHSKFPLLSNLLAKQGVYLLARPESIKLKLKSGSKLYNIGKKTATATC